MEAGDKLADYPGYYVLLLYDNLSIPILVAKSSCLEGLAPPEMNPDNRNRDARSDFLQPPGPLCTRATRSSSGGGNGRA